jgi:hypothetical protein
MKAHVDALRAENARLREALSGIAIIGPDGPIEQKLQEAAEAWGITMTEPPHD